MYKYVKNHILLFVDSYDTARNPYDKVSRIELRSFLRS